MRDQAIIPTLTVFTPAYNRANTLGRTYQSLCRQTCRDFQWVVVDDGSIDNTQALVKQWQNENQIPIFYYYKRNGGMASAHNEAYRHINTRLAVCIDSDDWMPDDAVEKILTKWQADGSQAYAGIIGIDIYQNGKTVGADFPDSLHHCKVRDLDKVHKAHGDKKYVYVVDIIKRYLPYFEVEGEKYGGVNYIYQVIDRDYDMLCDNTPYCIVEYQADGLSANLFNQYVNSPHVYLHIRETLMTVLDRKSDIFRHAIHYVSSAIFAKEAKALWRTNNKGYVLCAIPFGIILNIFVRIKRCQARKK